MKALFKLFLAGTLCCFISGAAQGQRPQPPLTNASIVKLVRAGFKEKTVIAIINSRPGNFRLEPENLIELKRSGVGENIILAMLAQDESFVLSDDEWTLDSTLGRNRNRGEQSQPGGDIFGSSGGSRGQTSGRGLSGANEQENTTSGSATVRILRPPTETGGGTPMKLEKTPTLDNEAVIKLVEAGFSEGTIIKRIEDSPADFDLSAAKIAELRRRRVPDTIITAMTAAMSEEPDLRKGALRTKGN
ncbi:MAG TPA: hypothetical protein VJV03_16015 [Pyrinomonadaceae bacterium]|nr:hypothetical protein [Pyrinomonadaceae bacterium]